MGASRSAGHAAQTGRLRLLSNFNGYSRTSSNGGQVSVKSLGSLNSVGAKCVHFFGRCSSPHSLRVYFQIPSRSRSAAGESRYSAMRAAELALEDARVKTLRLAALLTLDQCCAKRLDLSTALLLSPDKIPDVFAIVRVVATFDLRLDPIVLLVGQRNGLADSCHVAS